MKYLLTIILIAIIFLSCQMPTGWDYKDPEFDIAEPIDTLEMAWHYVDSSIDRVYDAQVYNVSEYWQYPAETYQLGSGDCEDMVLLLMHLTKRIGYNSSLGVIYNNGIRHAVMVLDGTVYEAQQYGKTYAFSDLVSIYPYDEAFHLIEENRLGRYIGSERGNN